MEQISGPDAAIVGHKVEAIFAVHRGIDRANRFARRILAVLAHDGLREHLRILGFASEIAIDADPGHIAVPAHLFLADDRNVILSLAGNDAGIAAEAGIQVYGHAPLLRRCERGVSVEGDIRRNVTIHAHGLRKLRIIFVAFERALAEQIATLHAAMLLSLGEWIGLAGHFHFHTREKTQCLRRAKRIRIESNAIQKSGDTRSSVTQRKGNGIVRVTRSHESRGNDGTPGRLDLDQVRDDVKIDVVAQLFRNLVERAKIVGLDAEFLCSGRADESDIVPGDLRFEIRSFLKPRVVGIAAIVHTAALEENQLQPVRSRFCVLHFRDCLGGVEGKRHFRPFATGSEAHAQNGIPFLRVCFKSLRKCLPDQFGSLRLLTSRKLSKDFEFAYPIPERKDHRLDGRVRAVVGINIAPRFKVVSSRDVPAAKFRGFVLEQARDVRTGRLS